MGPEDRPLIDRFQKESKTQCLCDHRSMVRSKMQSSSVFGFCFNISEENTGHLRTGSHSPFLVLEGQGRELFAFYARCIHPT